MNAITNCINKEMRTYTPFKIRKGKGYYFYNGRLISRQNFENLFPLPIFVKSSFKESKGQNSDHTKDWLQD